VDAAEPIGAEQPSAGGFDDGEVIGLTFAPGGLGVFEPRFAVRPGKIPLTPAHPGDDVAEGFAGGFIEWQNVVANKTPNRDRVVGKLRAHRGGLWERKAGWASQTRGQSGKREGGKGN